MGFVTVRNLNVDECYRRFGRRFSVFRGIFLRQSDCERRAEGLGEIVRLPWIRVAFVVSEKREFVWRRIRGTALERFRKNHRETDEKTRQGATKRWR